MSTRMMASFHARGRVVEARIFTFKGTLEFVEGESWAGHAGLPGLYMHEDKYLVIRFVGMMSTTV